MSDTIPKKFGFIRATLALWAANLFPGRAGVVTDAPVGSSTLETWGWWDGSAWRYAARRGGNEAFESVASAKGMRVWGATEPIVSSRYAKVNGDTLVGPSSTVEKSLLDGGLVAGGFAAVTDPANRWNVLGAQSVTELMGLISSTANQTITFKLYRNGAVVATLTIPSRTFGTATPWRLRIQQFVTTAGSSGVVRVVMRVYYVADNASATASCLSVDATLTGVNLTVASTWDVTATWTASNASNVITCQTAEKAG